MAGIKINKTRVIILLGALALTFACKKPALYDKNSEISACAWSKDSLIGFDVPIYDTINPANVFINLRHMADYPYSNIYFFVKYYAPNGIHQTDTIEYRLANNKGEWLGDGWGNLYSCQLPFKTNIRFPIQGIYRFEIKHGMRKDILPGVCNVGIRIDKRD
jgi:gliding motility-associated lipoprotein GldH